MYGMDIGSREVVTMISAVMAGATFIGIVLPLVNRLQKRERYQDIIARKRKDTFEASKTEEARLQAAKKAEEMSAKSTIETMFRVRKLVGSKMDDLRSQMTQAGYRSPSAPMTYVIMRMVLPLIFIIMAMLVV